MSAGEEDGPGRILFVNQHYPPDVASTGQHLSDLTEHLAEAGFDVDVLTSSARYEGGGLAAPEKETLRGVRVRRVSVPGFGRDSHLGRILDYAGFFAAALARLLFGERYDLVVYLTTPPLLPVLGLVGRLARGQSYAVWSMDLHPEAEEALGIYPEDAWYASALAALSDLSYRRADFVVDLGPVMKERIEGKGVPRERMHTIPVWNDADRVHPVPRSENPLIEEFGVEDRFVVMYSGNAGLGHRFEEVLRAMERFAGHPDIFFLFVGDGPRRQEIEEFTSAAGITNFAYHDYVDRELLSYSLSVAHVHLITLKSEMAGIAAPGKLYGILAAGRPALMVGPERSEPGHVIREYGVGTVVEPTDTGESVKAICEEIESAWRNQARCEDVGERARRVFVERFSSEVVLEQWEELLRDRLADR